jgi:hypothetical protein
MLLCLEKRQQRLKSSSGMFIFVSLPMKMIYYWSAIAHMSLYSVSAIDFIFIGRETSAHHRRDGTQTSKDVYDEWKRRNTLQRSGNKAMSC